MLESNPLISAGSPSAELATLNPAWSPRRKMMAQVTAVAIAVVGAFQLTGMGSDDSELLALLRRWSVWGGGAVAAGLIARWLLTLRQPKLQLVVSPHPARVGDVLQVGWCFSGSAHRVRDFELSWETRQYAKKKPDSKIGPGDEFTITAEQALVQRSRDEEPAAGTAAVPLPPTTRPSYRSQRARVMHLLIARATIDGIADFERAYEFKVQPASQGP